MSICDIKINNDITSPCKNPLYTGKKQKGWLINRDDVASYTLTGNYVTGITLVTGAQAYFIECNEKRPYQGTITAMEDGDTQNTFAHTVLCHMQNDGADFRTNVIEKLAGGRFVVILENLWGGENNDSFFPVYGLQRGLDCVAETTENVDNGGWDFTLAETGLPMAGLYYWHTDEETSRNDLDALAGGGGGEDWTPKWFYVEDASGAANTLTIKKSNNALPDKVFEWSLDKQNWTEITIVDTTGVSLAVPANGRVYLRGDNGQLGDGSYYLYMNCVSFFNVGGDITTLLYKVGKQKVVESYAFKYLFYNSRVRSSINLQMNCIHMGMYACASMFMNCSSMTETMEILTPTKSAEALYMQMYCGCTNLLSAPEIMLKTDSSTIGTSMFKNCHRIDKVIVHITNWNAIRWTDWLNGVAATGDFYNLGGATIPTGTNGIPSGWTEHTQLP